MDVFYQKFGQGFVWDSNKADSNFKKHRVSFEKACEIFFDPQVRYEDADVDEESRDAAVGVDFSFQLLFVVHAIRQEGLYRIISARLAEPAERRRYEESA